MEEFDLKNKTSLNLRKASRLSVIDEVGPGYIRKISLGTAVGRGVPAVGGSANWRKCQLGDFNLSGFLGTILILIHLYLMNGGTVAPRRPRVPTRPPRKLRAAASPQKVRISRFYLLSLLKTRSDSPEFS